MATKRERLRTERRKRRVRGRFKEDGVAVRVTVFRSLQHIYAQVIDDMRGVTIASCSSRVLSGKGDKTAIARLVGTELAKRSREAGCERVTFDRGSCRYHGRVRALAEGMREGGMSL